MSDIGLFVNRNRLYLAILVYVSLFALTCLFVKPPLMFLKSGELRQFGIGFKEKTVVPVWLFAFLLGIVSYVFTLSLTSL